MRNATAQFDADFEAPARPKAPRRPAASRSGGKRKKGKARFGLKFDMVPVARYGAIGMSGVIAIGILVNALMMQKGRHPAPLFGKSIALGQNAAAPRAAAPTPAPKVAAGPAAAPAETPRAASNAAPKADDASAKTDDAIGRLLQGGSAASADRPNTKTVLGVQHALTKLGFSVKQTGTFGPQTRKAIERFEKDHHLAVKGEMSRRVVKLLAAESHIKIEQ